MVTPTENNNRSAVDMEVDLHSAVDMEVAVDLHSEVVILREVIKPKESFRNKIN